MAYSVEYAINQANSGKSQFGKLPFTLKYVAKDDQGSATISPTDAQELVANKAVIGRCRPGLLRRHQGCRADLQRRTTLRR